MGEITSRRVTRTTEELRAEREQKDTTPVPEAKTVTIDAAFFDRLGEKNVG